MKSLQQSLMTVRDELNKIEGAKFFHYQRDPDTKKEYGVWMENGEGSAFHADNHKAEQQISGTLDYYTQIEYNPILDEMVFPTAREILAKGGKIEIFRPDLR